MIINYKKIITNICYCLLFLYILLNYIFGGQEQYTLIYKIPMFAFILIQLLEIIKSKKIKIPNNIKVLYLFCMLLLLSSFWAINGNLSITTAKTLFILITFYLIAYNFLCSSDTSVESLMKIIMWAGFLFSIYLLLTYGISNYIDMIKLGLRVGKEVDNVNRIGLESSITCLIFLFFGINEKRKYLVFLLIPLLVAIGTGSRKVVVILVLGTILLLLSKSEKDKVKSIIRKSVVIVLFVSLLSFVLSFISNFSISTRFVTFMNSFTGSGKIDSSTLERNLFIKFGWMQFLKTPFFGIGAGNSGYITMKAAGWWTYLHNNYIELLVTTGIFGFIMYYYNYFFLIKGIIKQKSSSIFNSNLKKFCLIFLLILLILDYGLVSYDSKITYIFLLIPLLALERREIKNA